MAKPIYIAGSFMLWETRPGEFDITDQRCPRAHAHVIYSSTECEVACRTLRALAADPPDFVPCAPGVMPFPTL